MFEFISTYPLVAGLFFPTIFTLAITATYIHWKITTRQTSK